MDNLNMKEVEGISLDSYAGKSVIALRTKLRGVLGDSGFLLLNLMNFVEFMQLHDKFADKGIFITKENKEEKYIEILEMEDEQLLNDLEKYISIQEKLGTIQESVDLYHSKIEALKELDDMNDVDAVNNVVKDYLEI